VNQAGAIHAESSGWEKSQDSSKMKLTPGSRVLVSVWAVVTETGPELTHLQLIELEDQNRISQTVFLWVPTNQIDAPVDPELATPDRPA